MNVVSQTMNMPKSFETPWLVTWCMDGKAIVHFNFRFRNLFTIGGTDEECEICNSRPGDRSTTELLVSNQLSKIAIWRHCDSNKI